MLGAADIARKAVLPAIAASRNGRIVALASRAQERARTVLSPYADAQVVESYEALLSRRDVDAVYVPLPNALHKEWAVRALGAGKHVLCEKPLALDAREAEEMADAAQASGKHLMEAFMYRFHPAMREFVQRLRNPIHIQSSFGFTVRDPQDIRLDPALGAGALYDVGCYTVSVARWILGEPVDVQARARVDRGIDLTVGALLQFSGDATAAVWSSLESGEIQELEVVTRDQVYRRERPFSSYRDPHDPYQLMVESFGDSVLNDTPVELPPSESIANMRLMDRIRESFGSF